MDNLWLLASGGSTIEQFASDVFIKNTLTKNISSLMKIICDEFFQNDVPLNMHQVPQLKIVTETSYRSVRDLLCNFEACLLHGIKAKLFINRGLLKGNKYSKEYKLDYWPVVLILSHKQVAECLNRLNNINTDIGKCRAWLRLALNEEILSNYLDALVNDTSLLQGFYKPSAYLRDKNHTEKLIKLINNLRDIPFQLNYDDSSFNSWSNQTLRLICVNVQSNISPVIAAVDALSTIKEQKPAIRQTSRQKQNSKVLNTASNNSIAADINNSINNLTSTSENDKESTSTKVFNCSPNDEHNDNTFNNTQDTNNVITESEESSVVECDSHNQNNEIEICSNASESQYLSVPFNIPIREPFTSQDSEIATSFNSDRLSIGSAGNSIKRKDGWSSSPPLINRNSDNDAIDISDEFQSDSNILSSTPDIKDIPASRKNSISEPSLNFETETNSSPHDEPPFNKLDFEIISKTFAMNNQEPGAQEFYSQLTTIACIMGLDDQDYKCYNCSRPIGLLFGRYRTCYFDGFNYCVECHIDDKFIIPARIINNWDFRKYPVAKKNRKKLELIQMQPRLDIKVSSPILYKIVKELGVVLELRKNLFYLQAYLSTCKESVASQLRKLLWPRDHLYEHIHFYSCQDLVQVNNNVLANQLRKAIQFSRHHVLSCLLCSQKGFICEICKSPQIIYPFDTLETHRCDNCKGVFHTNCFFKQSFSCPRCLRIRRREQAALQL